MKYFTNAQCLKAHLQSCHQHITCEICGTKHLKKNIKRHLRTHEKAALQDKIECSVDGCNLTFSKVSFDSLFVIKRVKYGNFCLKRVDFQQRCIQDSSNLQNCVAKKKTLLVCVARLTRIDPFLDILTHYLYIVKLVDLGCMQPS